MNKKKLIWMIPAGVVGLAAFIALGGWAVRELWNWLLPPLFGWHQIGFWQALGLLALCRILFGGLGCHNGHQRKWRKDEHWVRMTGAERDEFRQRMRERHGCGPARPEEPGATA
ncbi:MAG TPA: hypothetical protein VMJ34_05450 [Bryobacteraceae bacterium]|nr:hypothetical protein [Bryobacteraceae bacterium]